MAHAVGAPSFVPVVQIHPEDAFGQQMLRNLEVQQHSSHM